LALNAAIATALAVGFVSHAHAAPKQVCYQFCTDAAGTSCFGDMLNIIINDAVFGQIQVYGVYGIQGSYSIGVAGSLPRDEGASLQRRLSLTGTRRIGGPPALLRVVDGFRGGAWTIQQFAADGSAAVLNGELLKRVSCSLAPRSSPGSSTEKQ
jgi:hypothetical protein